MKPTRKRIKLDNETTSKLKLHELFEEMIAEILGYCNINDILKLSEVNKFWNSYVKNSQKWMKKITLTVTEKNYKEISSCTRQYQKVCIQSNPPLRSEAIKEALQHQLESIRDLEMPTINLAGIKFPKIRKLHLHTSWDYCADTNLDKRDFYFTKPRRDSPKRLYEDIKNTFLNFASQLDVLHIFTDFYSSEIEIGLRMLRNLKQFKVSLISPEQIENSDSKFVQIMSYARFNKDVCNELLERKVMHEVLLDNLKQNISFFYTIRNNSTQGT